MLGPAIHILLHLLVPVLAARIMWRPQWRRATAIMIATMVIDLDHLLAEPLYSPNRCSMGFHPLHTEWVIPVYVALAIIRRTRIIGVGLLIHMALDTIDCVRMAM